MTDIKHKPFTPPSIEELQAQHNAGVSTDSLTAYGGLSCLTPEEIGNFLKFIDRRIQAIRNDDGYNGSMTDHAATLDAQYQAFRAGLSCTLLKDWVDLYRRFQSEQEHNAGEVELYRKLRDKYGDVV